MDVQDHPGTEGPHTRREPPDDDARRPAAEERAGYDPTMRDSSAPSDDCTPSGEAEGSSTMTVEIDGRTRELPAEHDYTGDGLPDAAVETPDGTVIVFADTEDNDTGAAAPDGRADEAYVVDKLSGRVLRTARLDPASGAWVDDTGAAPAEDTALEDTAPEHVLPGDAPAGDAPPTATESGPGAREDETAAEAADGARVGGGTMIVRTGGETQRLPATKDYTGDGLADAAVETKDGQVIVFSDTEDNDTGAPGPDGRADEAWIVDKATGRVIGAARVDPETGEWVDGLGTADPSGPGSGSS